jgi:signal peptidase I
LVAAVARPRFDVAMGRLARPNATWLWPLVVVAAASLWAFDRVVVAGTSMAPTYNPGDRLLLVRRLRRLRVGDLVAFDDPRDPARRLVKRVQNIRGDVVDVVGDNATASTDSRDFGSVPSTVIRHLVVRRYALGGSP